MALTSLLLQHVAAIWFINVVVWGHSDGAQPPGLPGNCHPKVLTPDGYLPKIDESWHTVILCLKDLVVSGRELEKQLKIAAWRNNRYRQAFEPTVEFWGYLAGVPWPNRDPNMNTDTPLDNLARNSYYDAMTDLGYSTGKVKGLLEELSYYTGVKPKKSKKWYHPPPPPDEIPVTVRSPNVEITDEEADIPDLALSGSSSVPLNRQKLISSEPESRDFSDFFWHPKPEHRDREGNKIVHGRQLEKMQPDRRLDGHGFNPNMVWTEHPVPLNELGSRGV